MLSYNLIDIVCVMVQSGFGAKTCAFAVGAVVVHEDIVAPLGKAGCVLAPPSSEVVAVAVKKQNNAFSWLRVRPKPKGVEVYVRGRFKGDFLKRLGKLIPKIGRKKRRLKQNKWMPRPKQQPHEQVKSEQIDQKTQHKKTRQERPIRIFGDFSNGQITKNQRNVLISSFPKKLSENQHRLLLSAATTAKTIIPTIREQLL